MTGRTGVYTVEELAPGSFDVLLDGRLIAALTRGIDGSGDEWRIDLLDETPPSEYPSPFKVQSHIFISQQVAMEWLGIGEITTAQEAVLRSKPSRDSRQYRAYPTPSDRYRLRLLAKYSRFYMITTGLNSLTRRGLIAPTGRTDEDGRVEWTITDAGRALLAEFEF